MWKYDIVHSEYLAKNITQIILKPPQHSHMLYQAGQYIKILLPDGNVAPLSIANAPEENFTIELHLTHPADNLQAQDILRLTKEEKKIEFRGPYGHCTIDKFHPTQPIIFLARGTGFAPVKAIIEQMKKNKIFPRAHFYWSVTSPDQFYLNELLMQWVHEIKNFSYTPLLSRAHPSWQGKTGLLQDVILKDYPDLTDYLVYASAPESIVRDVLHKLGEAGLQRERYFSDVFDYDPLA